MRTFRVPLLVLLSLSVAGPALAGNQGTTLSMNKSASSTQTQFDAYSWTLQKTLKPNQTKYIIKPGKTVDVDYLITATRSAPVTSYTNTPVSGEICVTNTGSQPTIGLWITEEMQESRDGGATWSPYAGPQVIAVSAELASGANQCYSYSFPNQLDPTRKYRTKATASIDNYVQHEGESFSIDMTKDVTVTRPLVEIDKTANLTDTLNCPTGFSCTVPWTSQALTGSYPTTAYTVSMSNTSAACGQTTLAALNTANLTSATQPPLSPTPPASSLPLSASATASISTGTCRP